MKAILYLLIAFSLSISFQPQDKKNEIEVLLHLDKELSQIEQTVYISSFCSWISGYEQMIWDSVQIRKGDTKIKLHAHLPIKEGLFKVTFSKKGPEGLSVYSLQKDTIEINVTHKNKTTIFKKANKGEFHNFCVERVIQRGQLWLKRQEYQGTKNTDSLSFYNDALINLYRKDVQDSNHPSIATQGLTMLKLFFKDELNADSVQAMRKYIALKFPDYPGAALSYDNNTKQTQNGIWATQRLKEIQEKRYNYEKAEQNTKIGNKLNLKLQGLSGEEISLYSLNTTPYIYVDVWASWCKPCRKQFPYIKKALNKHQNSLKVYAISIDTNHDSWKTAIEKDSIQQFINVIGTSNHAEILYDVTMLGIEKIPRNFLLDSNLKIIATDLHDNQLLEYLDSLIQR